MGISIKNPKTFTNTRIESFAFYSNNYLAFKNISPKYFELRLMSSRKNAKKEKSARNRIAARRFSYGKIPKNFSSSEYNEKLTNYQSPFKYSAEEAESEAAKIPRK